MTTELVQMEIKLVQMATDTEEEKDDLRKNEGSGEQ